MATIDTCSFDVKKGLAQLENEWPVFAASTTHKDTFFDRVRVCGSTAYTDRTGSWVYYPSVAAAKKLQGDLERWVDLTEQVSLRLYESVLDPLLSDFVIVSNEVESAFRLYRLFVSVLAKFEVLQNGTCSKDPPTAEAYRQAYKEVLIKGRNAQQSIINSLCKHLREGRLHNYFNVSASDVTPAPCEKKYWFPGSNLRDKMETMLKNLEEEIAIAEVVSDLSVDGNVPELSDLTQELKYLREVSDPFFEKWAAETEEAFMAIELLFARGSHVHESHIKKLNEKLCAVLNSEEANKFFSALVFLESLRKGYACIRFLNISCFVDEMKQIISICERHNLTADVSAPLRKTIEGMSFMSHIPSAPIV